MELQSVQSFEEYVEICQRKAVLHHDGSYREARGPEKEKITGTGPGSRTAASLDNEKTERTQEKREELVEQRIQPRTTEPYGAWSRIQGVKDPTARGCGPAASARSRRHVFY